MNNQFSTPKSSIDLLIKALSKSDLSVVAKCGLRRVLDDRISVLGESKWQELMNIFQKARNKGENEYKRFREKIRNLGSREFWKLSKDEQSAIKATIGIERFILETGIKKLNPQDREKIIDVEKFIKGEEKEEFCVREGLDKIAREEWIKVKDYKYSILKNKKISFVRKEGKKIIKNEIRDYYENVVFLIENKVYIDDFPGCLLKGSRVNVVLKLKDKEKDRLIGQVDIHLYKYKNKWLIKETHPPLF